MAVNDVVTGGFVEIGEITPDSVTKGGPGHQTTEEVWLDACELATASGPGAAFARTAANTGRTRVKDRAIVPLFCLATSGNDRRRASQQRALSVYERCVGGAAGLNDGRHGLFWSHMRHK